MKTVALPDYLPRIAATPFVMGEMDCARAVAGWIEHAKGENPGAGHAYDVRSVARVIRRAGGLRALGRKLADEHGLVETDCVREGDVAVVALPLAPRQRRARVVFAIATGPQEFAVKTADGLYIGPATPLRAWTMRPGGAAGAETIGLFILSSIGVTNITLFAGVTLAQFVGTLVVTTLTMGAQYALSTLMAPKGKDPGQQQQTVKTTLAPRVVHYGRVKTGGALVFSHAYAGWWYNVIALGVGPLEIEEFWLGNKLVTLPVAPGPAQGAYGGYVWLDWRAGNVPETVYTKLRNAFPLSWTNNHRGDGIASAMVAYVDPGTKAFGSVYQGGIPQFRALVRGVPVFDPRDGLIKRSANPALCILDYLTREEGYNHARARCDLSTFAAFADLCDEPVPLKNGLTEPRYALNGTVSAAEARRDALKRMLDTCDGQIYMTGAGKIGIRGGLYMPPEVTLDRTRITARTYQFIAVDATDRANVLKPVYTSPQHDYQTMEAASWRDDARIAREGEVAETLDLKLVTSHTQAQRLAKIAAMRINAVPRMQAKCRFGAIDTYEQPTLQVQDAAFGLDIPMEVARWSMEIGEGGAVISIDAAAVDPAAWEWNAVLEEQPQPSVPATILDSGMPTPAHVVAFCEDAGGGMARLRVEFDPPAVDTLVPALRISIPAAPETPAVEKVGLEGDAVLTGDPVLPDATIYAVEVQLRSFAIGPWSVGLPAEAALVTSPPAALVSATASGAQGAFTANVNPGGGTAALRIYTNTANDFATATRRTTRVGAGGSPQAITVSGMDPGPIFIFVEPVNASGFVGPRVTLTANVS